MPATSPLASALQSRTGFNPPTLTGHPEPGPFSSASHSRRFICRVGNITVRLRRVGLRPVLARKKGLGRAVKVVRIVKHPPRARVVPR